ncbi:FtsX-like permease family protein [Pedobacter vanadiisoli]|uniref:FtsX-like permease family protein n=1 Tax=Pedobacter vanadiisoli TaxID=1761975 RepID=A0ABW5MF54_9SPHI
MFRLNLKIALRNLWRNKVITAINIGGLAIALAAFIMVTMYFTFETGFDKANPNYNEIYIIGRNLPDLKTNYTSPPLGKTIKAEVPEVLSVGTMKMSFFEIPVTSKNGVVFLSKCLYLDYDAAKMFNIKLSSGLVKPESTTQNLFYLSNENYKTLFPNNKIGAPELVGLGSRSSGMTAKLSGSVYADPHSNIAFDAVSVVKEMGLGEGYGYNNYNTYIQVRPGTDIEALEAKVNAIYKREMIKAGQDPNNETLKRTTTFLDPLKNLHLKPKAGTDTGYKVLVALSVLGILILVIACINFTNLSIAQAAKRAKEVGVKKVMGAYRFQLSFQFLTEILIQCFVATVLGLIIAEIILPRFNNLFKVNLSIWTANSALLWQLPLILIFITLIAGVYPAMVLSGFKPALVLKGNFQKSKQSFWLQNGLLVFQFSIAVIFITGLLIISSQLKYMRTQDVGFKPEQVVYIKNLAYFASPDKFDPIRNRIAKIPGVKSVTVANVVPDGSDGGKNSYTVDGKAQSLTFTDVDFDYFETLNIRLKEGRTFSREFKTDTVNSAILNEAAVAKYGLTHPIGKSISGCQNKEYKIVGIIKDYKTLGFEKTVEPTIYSINDPCGNPKTEIMLKIEESKMSEVLSTLKSQWPEINKLDGDNFRYQFLDEMYGRLFKKQEQLQSVFFAAALLTIFIALLGLFAFAKYITNSKIKEIAVRKILGASNLQIFRLINSTFFAMVVTANVISCPLAYILTKKWLETFAYRIDLPLLPFAMSAGLTILLTIITVSLQANSAVKANPVGALKYE